MSKIIWITSYPKSGNTWVRFVLANYFYNPNQQESDLTILNKIDKFPPYEILKKIADKELKQNPFNVRKYWIDVQKELCKNLDRYIFLKNHNALVKIDENELTNKLLSKAAIYIVRDPRDVLVSYLRFDKTLDKKKALERLTNKNLYCHVSKNNHLDIEVLGSWKFNYISWRDGIKDIPRIIVRYEDLLKNPFLSFKKIIVFLTKILNQELDINRLNFSIQQSAFNRLQNLEKKFGFTESKNKFFNTGQSNNWHDFLNNEDIKIIENAFESEMKELEYI